jgi:hypothetical protein
MKKEIKNVLRRFVNISAFMLITMVLLGPVFHVIDGITNTQIGYLTLCAAISALSSLIFISSKELHGGAWWVREILCILINFAIIVPLTHFAMLWEETFGMIVVMAIIIVIAMGNHLIEFLYDMRVANQINKRIKELR